MVNWNRVFRKNAASNQLAYFQISIFMRYEKSMNKIVKPLLLLLKCWKITAVYVWTNERNSQWKMLEKNIAFDWCFFWWKALQWSIFWQSHNKQHWMTLESAPVFVCACGHCHHSTGQFKVSNAHTHIQTSKVLQSSGSVPQTLHKALSNLPKKVRQKTRRCSIDHTHLLEFWS